MNLKNPFKSKPENETVNQLIAKNDINALISKFIANELPKTDGIMLIYRQGDHVGIDATGFTDVEAVWALEKAKHELLGKGLTFNG